MSNQQVSEGQILKDLVAKGTGAFQGTRRSGGESTTQLTTLSSAARGRHQSRLYLPAAVLPSIMHGHAQATLNERISG